MSRCFCYPSPRIKVARTALTPWDDFMLARDNRPRIDDAPFLPCVLAAVILIVPSSAHSQAQWTSNGVPVCVLPQCGGRLPMICGDGDHGALIAWQTDRDGNEDIYVQRVLYNGAIAPGWPAIGTPATRAARDQYLSDIGPDGQGGAFLVWLDLPNYDIYAQHVLGNGALASRWPANGLPVSVKAGYQDYPRLLFDGAAGVFVAWQDGDPGDIYAQHLNSDGTRVPGWPEGGLGVCTDPGDQGVPYLASDGHGGFFVAWGDLRNGTAAVFAARVTASGEFAPGWPANGKEIAGGTLAHYLRGIVPDGTGGVYTAWELSGGQYADDNDVYAIRILAHG